MSSSQIKNELFLNPSLRINGYSSYAIRHSILKALAELKKEIDGDVLDLGCGIMPYKEYLIDAAKITNYVGVDLEPTTYHHHVKPDHYWDGKKIPMEDNSFDWVIMTEFLEHYFDTQAILKEARRVLKPGGRLFFTVPCVWPLHEVPYDEYRFTPYSLQKHFLLAEYRDCQIKALGGFNLSLAIMLGAWLEHRDLSKRGRVVFRLIFTPFYKYLLRKDIMTDFSNNQYPSGLYGYATK